MSNDTKSCLPSATLASVCFPAGQPKQKGPSTISQPMTCAHNALLTLAMHESLCVQMAAAGQRVAEVDHLLLTHVHPTTGRLQHAQLVPPTMPLDDVVDKADGSVGLLVIPGLKMSWQLLPCAGWTRCEGLCFLIVIDSACCHTCQLETVPSFNLKQLALYMHHKQLMLLPSWIPRPSPTISGKDLHRLMCSSPNAGAPCPSQHGQQASSKCPCR